MKTSSFSLTDKKYTYSNIQPLSLHNFEQSYSCASRVTSAIAHSRVLFAFARRLMKNYSALKRREGIFHVELAVLALAAIRRRRTETTFHRLWCLFKSRILIGYTAMGAKFIGRRESTRKLRYENGQIWEQFVDEEAGRRRRGVDCKSYKIDVSV